ncbi:MAG: sulfate respiration complex hexadecaheme cytochrome HmcA [Pseudomonadota bacterium]
MKAGPHDVFESTGFAPGRASLFSLVGALALAAACGEAEHPTARTTEPAVLRLEQLAARGRAERPAVEFDHKKHVDAKPSQGCQACHPCARAASSAEGESAEAAACAPGSDKVQPLDFVLRGVDPRADAETTAEQVHALCLGCHQERVRAGQKTGPVLCGSCHVEQPAARSLRVTPRLDRSLHARHVQAEKDKCEACHHSYDEQQRTLVYKKNTEEACSACHLADAENVLPGRDPDELDARRGEGGRRPLGNKAPSLRDAAHAQCVNCHLAREAAKVAHGPTRCEGCHDAAQLAAVKRLDPVPRLKRNQPDQAWMAQPDSRSGPVNFPHLAHENAVATCSACHHQTLARCDSCHTLSGDTKGKGVTRAQAAHDDGSSHACVGCHRQRTEVQACVGCHRSLSERPALSACAVCHQAALIGVAVSGTAPHLPTLTPPALPAFGDAFPQKLVLDGMKKDYQGSPLPHGKIVGALLTGTADQPLALRFHQRVETLCAGCHHHSPLGERPPSCRSCHTLTADATRDRPGLKAAYHRQCLGCHQAMQLKAVGCEDCHKKASAEVTP